MKKNIYDKTIEDFGEEWNLYNYSNHDTETEKIFKDYFDIFPWDKDKNAGLNCLDLGCGTGRWSKILSSHVKQILLMDPSSKALNIAKQNLSGIKNVNFLNSKFEDAEFKNENFDFVFSLGVLHHMDNTLDQLKKINKILNSEGFVLIYLYYRFDNKSFLFKLIFKIADLMRKLICNFPFRIKKIISIFIATIIYWPLTIIYKFLNKFGIKTSHLPLAYYTDKSFYIMKTDSLDRFGTKVENRFLKSEIKDLLEKSGFNKIIFSDKKPYWHVIAYKKT
tara:strand:+ start:5000 stop:5833 length:834 start_codon:yes stop_codon:yes gene_type:complete